MQKQTFGTALLPTATEGTKVTSQWAGEHLPNLVSFVKVSFLAACAHLLTALRDNALPSEANTTELEWMKTRCSADSGTRSSSVTAEYANLRLPEERSGKSPRGRSSPLILPLKAPAPFRAVSMSPSSFSGSVFTESQNVQGWKGPLWVI